MVLLDSTAPAAAAKPRAPSPGDGGSYNIMGRISGLVLGLGSTWCRLPQLPPRSRDELRASMATASYVRSTIDDYIQATASMHQAASLGGFATSLQRK